MSNKQNQLIELQDEAQSAHTMTCGWCNGVDIIHEDIDVLEAGLEFFKRGFRYVQDDDSIGVACAGCICQRGLKETK